MLFVQRLAAFSGILQKVQEFFFRQHLYTKRLSFGKLGTGTGSSHDQRSLFAYARGNFAAFCLNSLCCLKPRKCFQGAGKYKRTTRKRKIIRVDFGTGGYDTSRLKFFDHQMSFGITEVVANTFGHDVPYSVHSNKIVLRGFFQFGEA